MEQENFLYLHLQLVGETKIPQYKLRRWLCKAGESGDRPSETRAVDFRLETSSAVGMTEH